MKPQSILKFFVFIICMLLSSTFLQAQKCNGPNKILVCQCSRASDFYCVYVCKCIHVNQLKEHLRNGWTVKTSSDAAESSTTSYDLFSVSVINSTSINVELAEAQTVSLKIFDVRGRLIKTLANSRMSEGAHQITWDKSDEAGNTVSAGIYILRFDAGTFSDTKKFSVIK